MTMFKADFIDMLNYTSDNTFWKGLIAIKRGVVPRSDNISIYSFKFDKGTDS